MTERRVVYTHPGTGAETKAYQVLERQRSKVLSLEDALSWGEEPGCRLLLNEKSGRVAVKTPAPSLMLDDGEVLKRVRLLRPVGRETLNITDLARSHWQETTPDRFAEAWAAELRTVPEFTERRSTSSPGARAGNPGGALRSPSSPALHGRTGARGLSQPHQTSENDQSS